MYRFGRHLLNSWRQGLLAPGMLLGWEVVISLFAGVRWLSQRPGWSVPLVLAIVILVIMLAGQLMQLVRLYSEQQPDWPTTWRLVWAHKWQWLAIEALIVVLALPLGLWGLSSRVLVRLPLAASWVNLVSLYRRPVVITAAIVYGVLATYLLLWGPRHFRRLMPQLTRHGSISQMLMALVISLMLTGVWWGMSEALVWVNWWYDRHGSLLGGQWLLAASLALVWIGFVLVSVLGVLTVVWSWCGQPELPRCQSRYSSRTLLGGLVCVVIAGGVIQQALVSQPQFARAVLISHRGVDHHRGVQNTLAALRSVSRERPDYVEMDLHETKDHRWVVLHDENLQVLANRRQTPHQLTLRQLERLSVHESGQSARLASWDHYLRTAERLHQPLMVEIKTTPQDSPGAVRRFGRQYGQRLIRDHAVVHSLDYRVVAELRRMLPALRVGYILPFNWVAPSSVPADFYSFQQISASQQFILAAHRLGAPAYIWTPDTTAKMTRMWALGADGQITNELQRLRTATSQPRRRVQWAILQNFIYSY